MSGVGAYTRGHRTGEERRAMVDKLRRAIALIEAGVGVAHWLAIEGNVEATSDGHVDEVVETIEIRLRVPRQMSLTWEGGAT